MADVRNGAGNIRCEIRNSWYTRKQKSSQKFAIMLKGLRTQLEKAVVAKDATSWSSILSLLKS